MNYLDKVNSWLNGDFDSKTKEQVELLKKHNLKELEDSFYKNLEFGTGGLRGIMGPGTNRMNQYTVGMATQGFAEYINSCFKGREKLSVAIAFDSRINSKYFAQITAEVFAANNIDVYIYDDLRPTPQLSYTIRDLKCVAGVMITASHNPKEYNGYKAYWEDGGQITDPHDLNIISEVQKIADPKQVKFKGGDGVIKILGPEADKRYLDSILSLSLMPAEVLDETLKIVYTPLHGTGITMLPEALKRRGFNNLILVDEQCIPDGSFPTVYSPNPEESTALALSLEYADKSNADLVLATDPDADRIGVAVRDKSGKMILLNGNQTAAILVYYILSRRDELKLSNKTAYVVKTIVTTELLKSIALDFSVDIYDVLTGFKYIAETVRMYEGKKSFIAGGEESYGFNVGELVRDKDAIVTGYFIADCAIWASKQGMTLYDLLIKIYNKYGVYTEKLLSITKKGKEGVEQIKLIMDGLRRVPLKSIDNSEVITIKDYLIGKQVDLKNNSITSIDLPKSDVLQYFTNDGTVVSVRPSGTEPKIKFYFGVNRIPNKGESVDSVKELLDAKLARIIKEFESL